MADTSTMAGPDSRAIRMAPRASRPAVAEPGALQRASASRLGSLCIVGSRDDAIPARWMALRNIPLRMLWRSVAFPATEAHVIAWSQSAAVVTARHEHRRPTVLAGSSVSPRCCMATRHSPSFNTSMVATGTAVSHAADAEHSQLQSRAMASLAIRPLWYQRSQVPPHAEGHPRAC